MLRRNTVRLLCSMFAVCIVAMRGTSKAAIYRYRKRLLVQMPCCCSPRFSMWDHLRGCPTQELRSNMMIFFQFSGEPCRADVLHVLTDGPVGMVPVAGKSTNVLVERLVPRRRTSRRLLRTWERHVAVDQRPVTFC
ncbi:uncharacterized protein DEA37_0008656 [Paragonimus westermani]|uniref:Secreted protein n=1 Tax=Paragonimus westermani TaxID=34504 RepID=A0A5J4N661_9TREM|nr:uncharacterized protein DEA37_0006135 [Paragonimus westermani]KAA3676337.1 uncharacterized protein DEA37_0006516 [Paragonimus westermani]KAA3681505.1 uncharacterized protein DEA37_0008656 [Paragonimus westermani]